MESKKRSIIFILDCSYSSDVYIKKYIDVINRTVEKAKKVDPTTLISIFSFNTRYETTHFSIPALTFPTLTMENCGLKPDGMTAMYDCLGAILVHLEKFYRKTDRFRREPLYPGEPKNIVDEPLIIILTDGEDNSSRVLGPKQLFFEISKLRNYNWKFVFLGTTKESINFGKMMAFNTNLLYDQTCTASIIKTIEVLVENDRSLKTGKVFESDLRELESALEKMEL